MAPQISLNQITTTLSDSVDVALRNVDRVITGKPIFPVRVGYLRDALPLPVNAGISVLRALSNMTSSPRMGSSSEYRPGNTANDVGPAMSSIESKFHLGVIRFLRDAGLGPSISHITAVSGGSILAAHLVLNWDRYSGSTEAYEEAASEVVRFGQLDVRNRIVRRILLGLPVPRRTLRHLVDRRGELHAFVGD